MNRAIEVSATLARTAGAGCVRVVIVCFYVAVIVVVECMNWVASLVRLILKPVTASTSLVHRIASWVVITLVAPLVPLLAIATAVGVFLGCIIAYSAYVLNVFQQRQDDHGSVQGFETRQLNRFNPKYHEGRRHSIELHIDPTKATAEISRPISPPDSLSSPRSSQDEPRSQDDSHDELPREESSVRFKIPLGSKTAQPSPTGLSPKAASTMLYDGRTKLGGSPTNTQPRRRSSVERALLRQQQYEGFQQQLDQKQLMAQLAQVQAREVDPHSPRKRWRRRSRLDSPPADTNSDPRQDSSLTHRLQHLAMRSGHHGDGIMIGGSFPLYEDDDGYLTPNRTPVDPPAWHFSSPIQEDENY